MMPQEQSSCCCCFPALADPQQQQYHHQRHKRLPHDSRSLLRNRMSAGQGLMSRSTAAEGSYSSAAAAGGSEANPRAAASSCRSPIYRRTYQQQQPPWMLAAAVLLVLLVVQPTAALPYVDISIGAPTAKSASVSYTWGLAASVIPTQVTMPVTEARPVSGTGTCMHAVGNVAPVRGRR
jgi:hypothetical protein